MNRIAKPAINNGEWNRIARKTTLGKYKVARHIQATVEYVQKAIEAAEREGRPQDWVTIDGMPISHQDAIAHLETMRTEGMVYVPCCENCDETGRCQGWER